MKNYPLSTTLVLLIGCAVALVPLAAPASASDSICHKATIEYGSMKQPILGFSWDGQPGPLAKGIMFETLMDRTSGDNDFVAIVDPESCASWQDAVGGGMRPTTVSFYSKGNKAAGFAQGGAEIVNANCDATVKTIVVKVGSSFNIGMPPS